MPRRTPLSEAELFDASRILREPTSLEDFNQRAAELLRAIFSCQLVSCWTLTDGRLRLAYSGDGEAFAGLDLDSIYGEHMRVDPAAILAADLRVNHISDIFRKFEGMGELYTRVWAPLGIDHQVSACLFEDDVFAGVASAIQTIDSGDFSALDVDAMHAIYPHLSAGYRACAELARAKWFGPTLARVIEAYPAPLFVLAQGQERPVYANREARRWMQSPTREGAPRIPLVARSRIAEQALAAGRDGGAAAIQPVEIIELPDWPELGLERPRIVLLQPPRAQGRSVLTARQRQILERTAALPHAADAARELGVTVATLRSHLKRIYRRLGASGLSEALAIDRLRAPG